MFVLRGPYHDALRALLERAWRGGQLKPDSLAAEMGQDPSTLGKYLRGDRKAGALDLDEADTALRHIGSTLHAFIADQASVQPSAELPVLVQRLMKLDAFVQLCEAVGALPAPRQLDVVQSLLAVVLATKSPRGGGPRRVPVRTKNHTKAVEKKHR